MPRCELRAQMRMEIAAACGAFHEKADLEGQDPVRQDRSGTLRPPRRGLHLWHQGSSEHEPSARVAERDSERPLPRPLWRPPGVRVPCRVDPHIAPNGARESCPPAPQPPHPRPQCPRAQGDCWPSVAGARPADCARHCCATLGRRIAPRSCAAPPAPGRASRSSPPQPQTARRGRAQRSGKTAASARRLWERDLAAHGPESVRDEDESLLRYFQIRDFVLGPSRRPDYPQCLGGADRLWPSVTQSGPMLATVGPKWAVRLPPNLAHSCGSHPPRGQEREDPQGQTRRDAPSDQHRLPFVACTCLKPFRCHSSVRCGSRAAPEQSPGGTRTSRDA